MANANIKAVITAEDRASAALVKFGSNVDTMGDKVATSLKRAAVAFVTASTAATAFALKSAVDFEQTRIGLENMLGSADRARKLLGDISKFAAETPFEFPELAQATRQLVAFGFSADDAFSTMKQLGDVSAAVGAPINDLAYLMGTLRAQGRAFTIDIRQFAMRGIPIYEYLGKVLGKNTQQITEMIEAGKIGFPEVQKAFQAMTAEGGAFHGTMAKQSKSLAGLWSTLKDNIGQTAREMIGITTTGDVKAGSLFDKLRVGAAELNTSLPELSRRFQETAMQIGDYLAPKVSALVNTIKENIGSFQELGRILGVVLVGGIGLAVDALNLFINIAVPIFNFLRDNTYIVAVLAGAFVGLKTALMFNNAVTAFMAGMALIRSSAVATTGIIGGTTAAAGALRSSLAVPMVMPAIAVGAALGALGLVIHKAIETQNVVEQSRRNVEASTAIAMRAVDALATRAAMGNARAIAELQKQGVRSIAVPGTPGFATGGFTGVGGANEVAGVVHRGEYVIPKSGVDQRTGMPKGGGGVNITIQAGAFMGSEVEARKFANSILSHLKDIAASKGTTLSSMMGA